MAELVAAGKVPPPRVSEAAPETNQTGPCTFPITACRPSGRFWTRDAETDGVLRTVRELKIGLRPLLSLGRGSYPARSGPSTTSPWTTSGQQPAFCRRTSRKNLLLVDRSQNRFKKGVSPTELALAWCWPRRGRRPIPGTKHRHYWRRRRPPPTSGSAPRARETEEVFPRV